LDPCKNAGRTDSVRCQCKLIWTSLTRGRPARLPTPTTHTLLPPLCDHHLRSHQQHAEIDLVLTNPNLSFFKKKMISFLLDFVVHHLSSFSLNFFSFMAVASCGSLLGRDKKIIFLKNNTDLSGYSNNKY